MSTRVLRPWTDLVKLHPDVETDALTEAMFAIDLGAIAANKPSVPAVYRDPEAFFRATYLTADLRKLLDEVLAWDEFTRSEIAQKPDLCLHSYARCEKVCDLGDHKDRHQYRARVVLEKAPGAAVFRVVGVVRRVEGAGVGDQRPASSDRRISSIRWETSLLPL